MADNKLAAVIEDLEAVPEAAQSFYEARDDGKFVLAVEGSLPNTVDKSRLDEFRDRNIEQAKELEETQKSLQEVTERYDGVDVSSYKKWAKEREDVERKKLIEAGEVEKVTPGFFFAQGCLHNDRPCVLVEVFQVGWSLKADKHLFGSGRCDHV